MMPQVLDSIFQILVVKYQPSSQISRSKWKTYHLIIHAYIIIEP